MIPTIRLVSEESTSTCPIKISIAGKKKYVKPHHEGFFQMFFGHLQCMTSDRVLYKIIQYCVRSNNNNLY